jgi:hypothetical protein
VQVLLGIGSGREEGSPPCCLRMARSWSVWASCACASPSLYYKCSKSSCSDAQHLAMPASRLAPPEDRAAALRDVVDTAAGLVDRERGASAAVTIACPTPP